MQTYSERSSGGLSSQTRRIAMLAILLFGLSGLISGFAVGAFVRPKLPVGTGNNGNGTTPPPILQSTTTRTPAPHEDVTVGLPIIKDFTYNEIANGTTSYSYTVQIVYKGTATPIRESDVTCKLWLTKNLNETGDYLNQNGYAVQKDITHIAQPFAHEVINAFQFTAPSQQTQFCTARGETKWTYTISTVVDPGTYYVFVLADWQGEHYNWYAQAIIIKAH